ncbi:transglutaminase superfamily protein [Sediminihabitans luteus]|uniref:Transglutaminase superfamily protein n=1 Tax=Sediminihabitans luteus TaxID=1138585 RepID=A0A2M9CZY7_9CELL|nr:transglutaminase-like domain-containing protein [Sediminihabitans luteus]PJJ77318.1 transglutaminase superfamily protein [Sediminihabitans luteus]GII98769.1 cysteine protease [Sediminihabitans luteus]
MSTTVQGAVTPPGIDEVVVPQWGGAGPHTAPTTPAGQGRRRPRRALTLGGLADGLVVVVLLVAAAVGLGPVWGDSTWVVPAAAGLVLGLVVAWVGAVRRWPAVAVAAATVVAYLLVGGAVALPDTTVAGVVPTLDTLRELLESSVTVWKDALTDVPPLGGFPELKVLPFLLLLLAGVTTATIAWRARAAAWAVVPPALTLALVIAFGTTETAWPLAQGLVLVAVGLLWSSWRVTEARIARQGEITQASADATSRLRRHRLLTGTSLVLVAVAVAALAAPAISPGDRTVLRETVVPPPDLHEYTSPLVGFRDYAKTNADVEMLTVEGLPAGGRVRIATLDTYDGVVYDVSNGEPGSGVFSRVGPKILTDATGTPADVRITVKGYHGPWLPDVGTLTAIDYEGPRAADLLASTYYNSTTGTAIASAGIREGDTYTLSALVPDVPSVDDLGGSTVVDEPLPQAINVPDSAVAKASQFGGDETDLVERLLNIRTAIVADGVYSSGLANQAPSRPGHSTARIDELLGGDTMVGDDEQFAVAFALMARQAGIPARVVMGFYPDEGELVDGAPWVATGSDVHAWIEVPLAGYGWVPIDAIPDDDVAAKPRPKTEKVPKPPVIDDPVPPEEPSQADVGDAEDDDEIVDTEGFDWGRAALIATVVVVPLALVAAPFAAILAAKARRRTRRRTAPRAVDRYSGGWSEVVDTATDLGRPVALGATRTEGAAQLVESFPTADRSAVAVLAHSADVSVFGTALPSEADAGTYWTGVDGTVRAMRKDAGWRARVRGAVSLRSLRGQGRRATGATREGTR